MRTLGVALVALACLIAVAGLADVFGPYLDAWGIPLTGSLYPWQLWLIAGAAALAAGAALWRLGDARLRRVAMPGASAPAASTPAASPDESTPEKRIDGSTDVTG